MCEIDGRYLDEFNREVKERNVEDKFIMVRRQPAERIPELLSACDAAFLSFQDAPLWTMTIPAKLQSYMACGMPIIAAVEGETKRIIEEAECGKCCRIGDAEALAVVVNTIRNDDIESMRYNSCKYFESHFNKKKLMNELNKYFEQ